MDIWNLLLVLLAFVVLVLLLLTVGIIRKLNELTELTAGLRPALPLGTPTPLLEAVTTDGATVRLDELSDGGAVLAFVSPSCPACHSGLAELDRLTRTPAAHAPLVLALVDGTPEEAGELLGNLGDGSAVQVAFTPRHSNPSMDRYKVTSYPRYVGVEADGTVGVTASSLEQLHWAWADRFAASAHGGA